MNDTDRRLYLLDAMALIYQAFYAYRDRPLINSKGVNTSAVHGFANVLYKLLKEEKPSRTSCLRGSNLLVTA